MTGAPTDTAVEPVAWKWRAMVKGEWSLWSTVDVDPNDWTWRDYWEDVEIVPLVPLSALTAQAAARVAAEKERDEAWGDLSNVAGVTECFVMPKAKPENHE